MDCPICLKKIENSCIGSCTHHFCYGCLTSWCHRGGNKCPVCSTFMYEIKLDREFDELNGAISKPINKDFLKKVVVTFANIKPGITLTKNNGPGVKIKSLKYGEQCYINGLRKDDVILFANNIPCYNQKDIIELINNSFTSQRNIIFEILKIID
tara:strand:+ start:4154 stop:4615 length:462 start_codon:yes stop_codon:yes gene_type:complete